jgi:hypothetical protein
MAAAAEEGTASLRTVVTRLNREPMRSFAVVCARAAIAFFTASLSAGLASPPPGCSPLEGLAATPPA